MIRKFVKRPIPIEAVVYDGSEQSLNEIKGLGSVNVIDYVNDDGKPYIIVPTFNGGVRADIGDYIIKGVFGEIYPCKPNVFHNTYTEVIND